MGRQLELTPRLALIAGWVPQGARIADVGTDHAYLPVWLTLHGRVASAIASDLRPGPLDRARQTGRRFGVEERISFRLGNGLQAVGPEECDTVVIAGMGGENIAMILSRAPWTADGDHTLLLQPQSRAEALRAFLQDHGCAIVREALVRDRGHLYPVMEAEAGRMSLTLGQQAGGREAAPGPPGGPVPHREDPPAAGRRGGAEPLGRPGGPGPGGPLREEITALYIMREEWRHANCPGN